MTVLITKESIALVGVIGLVITGDFSFLYELNVVNYTGLFIKLNAEHAYALGDC